MTKRLRQSYTRDEWNSLSKSKRRVICAVATVGAELITQVDEERRRLVSHWCPTIDGTIWGHDKFDDEDAAKVAAWAGREEIRADIVTDLDRIAALTAQRDALAEELRYRIRWLEQDQTALTKADIVRAEVQWCRDRLAALEEVEG